MLCPVARALQASAEARKRPRSALWSGWPKQRQMVR